MYIFQGALLCLIYIVLSIAEKLKWYIIKYIFNPKIEKKMSNRGLEGDKHIKIIEKWQKNPTLSIITLK